MDFWICCVLLLLTFAAISFLAWKMQRKTRRGGYIIGLVVLAVAAVALLVYAGTTLLLVNGVS